VIAAQDKAKIKLIRNEKNKGFTKRERMLEPKKILIIYLCNY